MKKYKHYDRVFELSIHTHTPSKWLTLDLHRDDVWQGKFDRQGIMWKRASKRSLKKAVSILRRLLNA